MPSPLLHTARFALTAADIAGLPPGDLPEVAFVGRSNAGKSTCINTLTQQKRLAFASKMPGRTQHINYFALGYKQQTTGYLVDLPGYGYAAVPKAAKLRWQRFLAQYLATREALRGLVLIVDSRLGVTPIDLGLLEFMNTHPKPVHVLLGKADKLSGGEKTQALRQAEHALGEYLSENGLEIELSLQTFSATKREGLDDLSALIEGWLSPV
jgi:GTP-binding protein